MIWKSVLGTQRILLRPRYIRHGKVMGVTALSSVPLSSTRVEGKCVKYHDGKLAAFSSKSEFDTKSKARRTGCLLRWLRTCRQIYVEAQPLVTSRLHFHFCNLDVFKAFIMTKRFFRNSSLDPSLICSISLCLKLSIDPDLRDGFFFSPWDYQWGNNQTMYHISPNWARPTFNVRLANKLSALRDLRLEVYFTCTHEAANQGFARLVRQKKRVPLACRDKSKTIKELAERLCGQKPWSMFVGKKIDFVDVHFWTGNIIHDVQNRDVNMCWCKRSKINQKSIEETNLAEEIKTILKGKNAG